MAGHSKWSTIKRKKGALDQKRGKIFSTISKEITVSSRLGGKDIDSNPRLRQAVKKAKSLNMPNSNIDKAIKKGVGELDNVIIEEVSYEGYGPFGVAILIEAITDNKNRTVAEVRHAFSKFGGSLGTDGSVAYLFTKVGQLVVENSDEEKIFDVSVSNGAEEVEKGDEDNLIISVEAEEFHNLKNVLEENEIKINQYELIMKASNSVELDDEASEKVINLLESLEDLDDVQNVHSNAEFSEGSFA